MNWWAKFLKVSSLLYGTLFLIVKCTIGGLHLKIDRLLHPSLKFRKISILLASAGSFIVKNDNFHTFFWLSWLQMLNLPASLQNKNTQIGPFPWKRSVLQNPDRERTNQSTGICLGLGLPYNNYYYSIVDKGNLQKKSKTKKDYIDTLLTQDGFLFMMQVH